MSLTYPKRERLSVWLQGEGIEIGALNRPLLLPPGAAVRYVDRMTVDQLEAMYPELEGQALTPVDIIGDIEHMPSIADDSQDFVIANHLIEHLHDPIRGLQEMYRVLRDGGVLFMAIPEPRVTFDNNRPRTPVEHLLREHREGPEATLRDHYVEWVTYFEGRTDGVDERAAELMASDYSIHFHVWRPDDFLEFLVAAKREANLDLEFIAFGACEHGIDDEYVVLLRKGGATPPPPQPVQPPPSAPPSPQVLEAEMPPTPPPPPRAPTRSLHARLRGQVAASRLAPLLRPAYRAARRLLRRR